MKIMLREVKNYLKKPLFWIGIVVLFIGVFRAISPYLDTRYLNPDEKIVNDFPIDDLKVPSVSRHPDVTLRPL